MKKKIINLKASKIIKATTLAGHSEIEWIFHILLHKSFYSIYKSKFLKKFEDQ